MPLLTIQASNDHVPAGAYNATFKAFEEIETAKGPAYRWVFTADNGRTLSGLSDKVPPTPKNRTGRWLSALSGKPPAAGVQVDPEHYVGRKYMCIFEAYNDASRLTTFTLIA